MTMDNDYIVMFDETGQPYIAHFSLNGAYGAAKNRVGSAYRSARSAVSRAVNPGVGRGVRVNHKYIAKIGNRYIYDAKELAAIKANKAKAVTKNTVSNVKKAVNRNGTLVRSSASKTANKVSGTVNSAKTKASNASVKVKENLRKNTDVALSKLSGVKLFNTDDPNYNKLSDRERHAENGAKIRQNIEKKASETAENVKNKAKEKANGVADKAKNVANKVGDKAKDIAGVDERQRRDAAKKDYNIAEDYELHSRRSYAAAKDLTDSSLGKGKNPNKSGKDYKNASKEDRDRADRAWAYEEAKEKQLRDSEYNRKMKDLALNTAQKEYDRTPLGMIDKINIIKRRSDKKAADARAIKKYEDAQSRYRSKGPAGFWEEQELRDQYKDAEKASQSARERKKKKNK